MILHPDFRDLLAAFAAGSVRYLVIGGYAVGFHDRPRYTKDIDLWIDSEPANLARCAQALEEFGAPQNVITAIVANDSDTIVWMGVAPQRIDLLTEVPGAEFATAYARRVDATWDDQIVNVVGLDDLIATKRAANRDKDQLDAKHLERVRARRDS